MADKKITTTQKPKTAEKPEAAPSAKPAAKTAAAAKPAATSAKNATAVAKPAAKPAVTAKPKVTAAAKPAAKPAAATAAKTTVKPAAKSAAAPVVKPAANGGGTVTVKPAKSAAKTAAASKPAATVAAKAEAKPVTAAKSAAASTPSKAGKTAAATTAKTQTAAKSKTTAKTKSVKTGKSGGGSPFAALTKNKKLFYIIVSAVALVFVLALVLGIALGVKSCKNSGLSDGKLAGSLTIETPSNGNYVAGSNIKPSAAYSPVSAGVEHTYSDAEITEKNNYAYNAKYVTNTVVGYSGKVVGTVDRKIPAEVRDEGLGVYPKYGSSLTTAIGGGSDAVAARNALIRESSYLTAAGTTNAGGGVYTWMDENGFLYSGTRAEPVETLDKSGKQRRLYKHTASVGLYLGNVSDSEPGIIKEVTMRNRAYNGYGVTGVYAPAGEVIKIRLSGKDMDATGGITVHIGQALYNGKANNIWTQKNQMQRIPHLLNTMQVNKNTAVYDEDTDTWTAYVGSFIGGPVYIRNISTTFTATISGGVAYRHFILGYTTEDEFEELSKSSVPYFDLEVWDRGVLHSGPLNYAKNFDYEQLYNAAVLWDKVASVSTTNGTYQGIVFLYDPFVAAGAAVAFPGQRSVNCPMGWMSSSLNYDAIVTSGSWGNFHEYHHNFQNYGVGDTGEVTNNALTLVSYSLFTKISSARQIASYGGAGLSGWNQYTSASWALQRVNLGGDNIKSTNGLAVYSTLLHNLGQDAFIASRGVTGAAYFDKWADNTHQDFSYFASQITAYTGTPVTPAETKYPAFVPVSSVYQTGRSYLYRSYDKENNVVSSEKRDIETMQPYVIPYDSPFTVDLRPYNDKNDKGESTGQYVNGSVVIGNGFKYSVKGINTSGLNGNASFTRIDADGDGNLDDVYTLTPDKDYVLSGKIRVTLQITTDSGANTYNGHVLDDVDLILEFQQSHETKKAVLERTTYTYEAGNMYTDAEAAYESGFAGYSDKSEKWDHANPTQNCNTDIWFYPDTAENRAKYPNAPESYFVHENTVEVIDGKLYLAEEGKYRVYLRGRSNCALYYSLDGKAYTLGATIKSMYSDSANFHPNDENTYFDIEVTESDLQDGDGLWVYLKEVLIVRTTPMASYIGVGLSQWTVPLYSTTTDEDGTTHYYDASGKEVSAEEANKTDPIPPTKAAYVNAYRNSYEFPDNSSYQTDYFYIRDYNYNFVGTPKDYYTWDEGVKIVNCNKQPWDNTTGIENLLTEGQDTFFHTNNASNYSAGPMVLELDMGKEIAANSVTFLGRTTQAANTASQGLPNAFTLEVSTDGVNYTAAGTYTNPTGGAHSATVNLDGTYNFRYVKLTITSTHSNNKHFILSGIKFTEQFKLTGNGANHIAPDNAVYSEGFGCVQTTSCFGHAYLGKNGDTVTLEFTGTRFAVLNTSAYESNYEVWIDGSKVDSVELADVTGAFGIRYLSEELADGAHTVEIRCKGEACFDSFAFYS